MKTILIFFICCITLTGYSKDLIIGRAGENIKKEYKLLKPIVQYLASNLNYDGCDVNIYPPNDSTVFIKDIEEGNVDIIMESANMSNVYKMHGAKPILSVMRENNVEYSSYIFVRTDSGINSIKDLKGKTIAFEDITSTSAFKLPKMSLEKKGLVLTNKSDSSPDTIKYIFAGNEINISTWVYFNKVDAGALSSLDWITEDENPMGFRKDFKIILKSESIPNMILLVSEKLEQKKIDQIKKLLLNMHKTEQGRDALKNHDINQFLELRKDWSEALQ